MYIHRGKEKDKCLQRKGERDMTLIPGFCMGIVSISLSLSVTLCLSSPSVIAFLR